jgi:iron complex transport system substrate-binding protein
MKKIASIALLLIVALALAACGGGDAAVEGGPGKPVTGSAATVPETAAPAEQPAAAEAEKPAEVEVTDIHGTVTVKVNPKNVVALDNRTFETLADWGIELAAVPKNVMPADSPYVADEKVLNVGNHTEPNLEIIAAADPELVIVGQRFARYYEDIKALVPNAVVIDLNFDVSAGDGTAGQNLADGFRDTTKLLGQIFGKNEEADALVARFDAALEAAKSAYNGTDTVISIIVSGGNIGYSAPHNGRVWGPLHDLFGWVSPLSVDNTSTDHQGDEISVEAIAQANPDWLMVLDRDAAISSQEEKIPAADVIANSPALQNTTAVTKGQIVYAPADTYTNESIQTYIEIFEEIAKAMTK